MIKHIKEKIISATGSVSGAASVLGSWQVCHNVCLGIIALLSLVGITIAGMPLLFLTKIAVPFWIAAFTLLLVTIALYTKKKCISGKLILFNSGLIIAGVPFKPLQGFLVLFWVAGGILVFTAIFLFIKYKTKRRKVKK